MKLVGALLVALLAIGGARIARNAAASMRLGDDDAVEEPYTPSAEMAPILSLGYREALADLLYVRLRVYFGGYYGTTANGIVSLGEAIVALDPRDERVYNYAANATTIAHAGSDQNATLRSIALLERGIREFPDDWKLLYLAGQIYIQDLKSDDEAQVRKWRERGTLLVESAIRKPGAPAESGTWAASLRTKLGQRTRAVEGLRELLLVTPGGAARKRLIEALAKLEGADSTEIAAEIFETRRKFESTWKAERPFLKPSMYLLLGARPRPGFDMTDLATGGRDLIVGVDTFEKLEPLE